MKKNKIFIVICIAVIMVLISMIIVVGVMGLKKDGVYVYKVIDDGTVEIEKYLGNETEIDIPSELGGKTVTSIGKKSFSKLKRNEYTTVNVPDTVTSIGELAFAYCQNLTIRGCENVEEIRKYAFIDSSFAEPNSFPECNKLITIGDNAFSYAENLGKFYLADSVEYIGEEAFQGAKCTIDKIPDGVKHIGIYGLGSGYSYNTEKMEIVGDNILLNITGDGICIVPDGVKSISIGDDYYEGMYGQSYENKWELYIPDTVTDLELQINLYRYLEITLYIPSSITTINGETDPQKADSIIITKSNYMNGINIICEPDSYAESYAKNMNINYTLVYSVQNLYEAAVASETEQ
jgi:hypothetical protein